jgi:hypothetical protein
MLSSSITTNAPEVLSLTMCPSATVCWHVCSVLHNGMCIPESYSDWGSQSHTTELHSEDHHKHAVLVSRDLTCNGSHSGLTQSARQTHRSAATEAPRRSAGFRETDQQRSRYNVVLQLVNTMRKRNTSLRKEDQQRWCSVSLRTHCNCTPGKPSLPGPKPSTGQLPCPQASHALLGQTQLLSTTSSAS